MEDIAIIQKQFIAKKAAEYRSRGYEVLQDTYLDFLPNVSADLVVRKNGETKVIQVTTRTSLAVTPEMADLAEAISAKPGWSFDLLVVGEPERLDAPDNAQPFTESDIGRRIDQAETVLGMGFAEASFLLAWSACEAAIRKLAAAEGVDIKRATHSGYVLGQAVHHGAISRRDDEYLSEMLAYRNAIAHGLDVPDFDDERARELIVAAKTLLRASLNSEQAQPVDILAGLEAPPH